MGSIFREIGTLGSREPCGSPVGMITTLLLRRLLRRLQLRLRLRLRRRLLLLLLTPSLTVNSIGTVILRFRKKSTSIGNTPRERAVVGAISDAGAGR